MQKQQQQQTPSVSHVFALVVIHLPDCEAQRFAKAVA